MGLWGRSLELERGLSVVGGKIGGGRYVRMDMVDGLADERNGGM